MCILAAAREGGWKWTHICVQISNHFWAQSTSITAYMREILKYNAEQNVRIHVRKFFFTSTMHREVAVHCMWPVTRAILRWLTLYWKMGLIPIKLPWYGDELSLVLTLMYLVCDSGLSYVPLAELELIGLWLYTFRCEPLEVMFLYTHTKIGLQYAFTLSTTFLCVPIIAEWSLLHCSDDSRRKWPSTDS